MVIRKRFQVRMEDTAAYRRWQIAHAPGHLNSGWGSEAVKTVMEEINQWLRENEYTIVSLQELDNKIGSYTILVFAEGDPKPEEEKKRQIEL